jgi:hypothetical protein
VRSWLYADTRAGGITRWVLGDPAELMRIPDNLLDLPVFLCVDDPGEGLKPMGTAFFLGLRGKPPSGYLVTARHCVEKARSYGQLYARLNKVGGGIATIKLENPWFFGDNDADDVAVASFPLVEAYAAGFDGWPMEIPVWCLTEEKTKKEEVGVGDEVIAVGLFTHRDGKHQNRPIVRSGIIAAMPDEPLDGSRGEYDAYLVEIRSIGGLSGSPVFLMLPPGRVRPNKGSGWGFEMHRREFFLMGLVRGHWDKNTPEYADMIGDDVPQLNTGVAIVTPIHKAVEVIMNKEELVKERKQREREAAERNAPTEDSALPEETGAFDRFQALAHKLVQVPKKEIDKKRKGRS